MRKDFCDKCGKEINFNNCYEVCYGKVEQKNDGDWNYQSGDNINLCPECYKIFQKEFAPHARTEEYNVDFCGDGK